MYIKMYDGNIAHHEARSAYWLEQGKPDYAEGSMRKAAKWREKRRAIDQVVYGPLPDRQVATLLYEKLQAFEDDWFARIEFEVFGHVP